MGAYLRHQGLSPHHRGAVDGGDEVAGAQTGFLGGGSLGDLIHLGPELGPGGAVAGADPYLGVLDGSVCDELLNHGLRLS